MTHTTQRLKIIHKPIHEVKTSFVDIYHHMSAEDRAKVDKMTNTELERFIEMNTSSIGRGIDSGLNLDVVRNAIADCLILK